MNKAKRGFHLGTRGQGLAEYALILALVAVVAIVVLSIFGPAIRDILSDVTDELSDLGIVDHSSPPECDDDDHQGNDDCGNGKSNPGRPGNGRD